jgi:hypothetical protein
LIKALKIVGPSTSSGGIAHLQLLNLFFKTYSNRIPYKKGGKGDESGFWQEVYLIKGTRKFHPDSGFQSKNLHP